MPMSGCSTGSIIMSFHIVKNIGGELHESFVEGDMTPEQIEQSDFLVARFADYVNSLGLEDGAGTPLELSSDGSGSFRDYVTSFVVQSAQRALDQGADLSGMPWITVENGKITALDLAAHARYATRMKQLPAFDQWDLKSPENELFGTTKTAVPALHGIRESPQYSGRGAVRLSHSRPDEPAHLRQRGPFSGVPSLGASALGLWIETPQWPSLLSLLPFCARLGSMWTTSCPGRSPTPGTTTWTSFFTWIRSLCP